MIHWNVTVRAALAGLALALVQGCSASPERTAAAADAASLTKSVMTSLYEEERVLTGSRIPRVVDRRISVEGQSAQPLKVVGPPGR